MVAEELSLLQALLMVPVTESSHNLRCAHLSRHDLQALRLVSRAACNLANFSVKGVSLKFDKGTIQEYDAKTKALQLFPNLHTLELQTSCEGLNDESLQSLLPLAGRSLASVTKLQLTNWMSIGAISIGAVQSACQHLVELDIQAACGHEPTTLQAGALHQLASKCNLSSLHLQHAKFESQTALQELGLLTALKALVLESCKWPSKILNLGLFSSLAELSKLVVQSATGAHDLDFQSLSALTHLTQLVLNFQGQHDDDELMYGFEANNQLLPLVALHNLRHLDLGAGFYLDEAGMQALSQLSNLTSLCFGMLDIDDHNSIVLSSVRSLSVGQVSPMQLAVVAAVAPNLVSFHSQIDVTFHDEAELTTMTEHLKAAVGGLPQLTSLSLLADRFDTCEGPFAPIIAALVKAANGPAPWVQALHFEGMHLAADDLTAVAEMLPAVTRITCKQCDLDDSFLAALSLLPGLGSLDLYDCSGYSLVGLTVICCRAVGEFVLGVQPALVWDETKRRKTQQQLSDMARMLYHHARCTHVSVHFLEDVHGRQQRIVLTPSRKQQMLKAQ